MTADYTPLATSVSTEGSKTILVIIDGLAAPTAMEALGCTYSLVDGELGHYQTIRCELPSMSLPMYECILTGKEPVISGVYSNKNRGPSRQESLFHLARANGLTTAACAYHWVSELYNHYPFDPKKHRYQFDQDAPIQNGMFYNRDDFPDSMLFQDAEYLVSTYQPDFLLIHPMGVDNAGHVFGADSKQYKNAARGIDEWLSFYGHDWLKQGYQILVTADHGFSWDNNHGGTEDNERNVPLFALGHRAVDIVPRSGAQQTGIFNYVKSLLLGPTT